MKKHVLIFTLILALFAFSGCIDKNVDKMQANYPTDYDVNYGIRQVIQYDPMNINGIDISSKFSFFETFRLIIHFTDSKVSAVTFTNADVPFSPFDFTVPSGKVEAFLDTEKSPNALRLKATGDAIAYFLYGEFSTTFQLDCQSLSYKYTFKSVE